MPPIFRYRLTHQQTLFGVGYFSPEPLEPMTLAECLKYIQLLPNDEFMRAYVRPLLAAKGQDDLREMFHAADDVTRALILETAVIAPALSPLWAELRSHAPTLKNLSPQLFLASAILPDHDAHAQASLLLSANIFEHQELPKSLAENPDTNARTRKHTDPSALARTLPTHPPCPRKPAAQTQTMAMERLYGLGIVEGPEMRHHASLAPCGLLRRWRLDRTVQCNGFNFRLDGVMTSYGRGLCLDDARASLSMEIVERYSSFADIRDMKISGSMEGGDVQLARWSELAHPAMDPNSMHLEIPYCDQPLHWMEARDPHGHVVLVPVQAVYLFSNLNEIRLFTGLGSTGLAAGNTPEEAKVSGLLEVVERDSEAVRVFDSKRCFCLRSRDGVAEELLARYRAQGVDPIFQDLTTELGVPCYKCFVLLNDGGLVKATGASLSGRQAALSALTETPFPFPGGPASARTEGSFPERFLEDLPEHGTGSAAGDLDLLEAIIHDQGLIPVYANLTKREMGLPVFRAIVPGLEIVADYDRFTRVSPRMWRDIVRVLGKGA